MINVFKLYLDTPICIFISFTRSLLFYLFDYILFLLFLLSSSNGQKRHLQTKLEVDFFYATGQVANF